VKTLQKKKRRLKHKQSQPDVVIWDDPEWSPALNALEGWPKGRSYTGKSDPKPLAELLCSGKPVPEPVAWRLGVLLNPPWGRKGSVLMLSIHKRYTGQRELKFIKEMLDLKKKIEEARKGTPRLKSAIMDVARETGKSRSHLMKAWKFTLQRGVPLLAKYNPLKI
jgi:hypothetical protein